MRTIIIESSTRKKVADCSTLEDARLMAFRRQVANSDMLFVMDSADINLHLFAAEMHKEFRKLIKLHCHYNSRGYKVDLAPYRCDLWRRITESREVRFGRGPANPLSETIGDELADDIELLLRRKDHPHVLLLGIDMHDNWIKAYSRAAELVNRYRDIKFDLLLHEILGIMVIAAEGYFAASCNFAVKKSFGPKRMPR